MMNKYGTALASTAIYFALMLLIVGVTGLSFGVVSILGWGAVCFIYTLILADGEERR